MVHGQTPQPTWKHSFTPTALKTASAKYWNWTVSVFGGGGGENGLESLKVVTMATALMLYSKQLQYPVRHVQNQIPGLSQILQNWYISWMPGIVCYLAGRPMYGSLRREEKRCFDHRCSTAGDSSTCSGITMKSAGKLSHLDWPDLLQGEQRKWLLHFPQGSVYSGRDFYSCRSSVKSAINDRKMTNLPACAAAACHTGMAVEFVF